jgi:hypothetical protein
MRVDANVRIDGNFRRVSGLSQFSQVTHLYCGARAVGLLDGAICTSYELMFRKMRTKRLDQRAQHSRRVAA